MVGSRPVGAVSCILYDSDTRDPEGSGLRSPDAPLNSMSSKSSANTGGNRFDKISAGFLKGRCRQPNILLNRLFLQIMN